MWLKPGSGMVELPSDFFDLDPPDAGCHKFDFWLLGGGVPEQAVTLFTKVICCEGGGDCTEESASTVTYHQFTVPAGEDRVQSWKYFACEVIPAQDVPDCAALYGETSF